MIIQLHTTAPQPQLFHFKPQLLQLDSSLLLTRVGYWKYQCLHNYHYLSTVRYCEYQYLHNYHYLYKSQSLQLHSLVLMNARISPSLFSLLPGQSPPIHSVYLMNRNIHISGISSGDTNHNDEALLLHPKDRRLHLVRRNRQQLLQVPHLPLWPTSVSNEFPVRKDTPLIKYFRD